MRLLACLVIALVAEVQGIKFLGYNVFGSNDNPWNVCELHELHCNCDASPLRAMSEGLDCTFKKIQGLADEMIIPREFTKVDFSGNNITSINNRTFYSNNTHVQELSLSANAFETVENETFINVVNIENLDLSNNVIRKLDTDSLKGLNNLKTLDLSYNRIVSIQEGLFQNAPNITTILLDYNPTLLSLSDNAFTGLKKLKSLDLSNIPLKTIHYQLFKDLRIKNLKLMHCSLTSVPTKALFQLSGYLKSIDLSGNPIKVLSSYSIYSLPHLTSVTLEQMIQLTTIEAYAFNELPNLRTLVLKYLPKIKSIDELALASEKEGLLYRCPIQDFTLSYTVISQLPQNLLNWDKLKYLNLHNNRWTCDCNLKWIKGSAIEKMVGNEFFCSHPSSMRGVLLTWAKPEEFICGGPAGPGASSQFAVIAGALLVGTIASLVTVTTLFYRRNGYIFRAPRHYSTLVSAQSRESITVYDPAPRETEPPVPLGKTNLEERINDATEVA